MVAQNVGRNLDGVAGGSSGASTHRRCDDAWETVIGSSARAAAHRDKMSASDRHLRRHAQQHVCPVPGPSRRAASAQTGAIRLRRAAIAMVARSTRPVYSPGRILLYRSPQGHQIYQSISAATGGSVSLTRPIAAGYRRRHHRLHVEETRASPARPLTRDAGGGAQPRRRSHSRNVSEPDLRSTDEARAYLTTPADIGYAGVSECSMAGACGGREHIHRTEDMSQVGTRHEVKN